MRTLNLRINFFWDDGDDMETFELTVKKQLHGNVLVNKD